jgi:hypothetical protein
MYVEEVSGWFSNVSANIADVISRVKVFEEISGALGYICSQCDLQGEGL